MAVDMALVQAIVRLTLGEQLLLPAVTQAKPPKQPQIEEEIGNRMSRIQSELLIIQSFLSEVDMRKRENQIVETWIAQARTLAYRTEDVVDEYIRIVYQQEQSYKFGDLTKRLFWGDQNWIALQAVDAELIKILTKLTHLSQMKGRWMEIPSMLGKMTNQTSERRFHRETSSHFLSEEQLVGIQENREKLIDLLQSNNESALSVVSVWGMGGIGKTTLVTNIYKRESQNFQCHAWISISQSYKIDDILRKLIKELYCRERRVQDETQIMNRVPDDIQNMDTRNLKEILRSFLEQKKYLIILDDVWIPAAFLDLCDCLVDNHQGSRIIITTRIADVASLAHDRCKLQLKPLGEKEAWDLFCKRAFWKERDHACPSAIEKYAKDIVTKCEGLPLAIVSVGNLLSLRQHTESEWRRVYQQFNWELEHNPSLEDVKNVLYLSYNDLPTYLKNCFLYCSMFSEGYLLHRRRLIKLWIAEGFVQERGNNTLEEVAEDYLNELINRSMLQVEETNILGRVRSFRMHYLMRELAFSLSRKESFHTVYDNNATVKVDNDRRLAVHGCGTDMSSSINMPLLRTFKAFNGSMLSSLFLSSALTKSRYLAVLDLDRSAIETIPDEIGDFFNLRYLGLRNSKVKSLPESIGKLFNLQTLDLVGSDIKKLPLGIVKLNKLRHLSARKLFDSDEIFFQYIPAPQTPEGLWNLKELQTLMAVEAKGELVERLKDLTQLRSLGIYILKDIDVAKLCSSLSQMHFLFRLYLIANDEDIGLQTVGLSIPPPHLYFLFMRGRLSSGIVNYWFGHHGNSLRELSLVDSKLEEDPMSSLSKLSNLTRLILQEAYNGEQLRFGAGWFPILQHLSIGHMPHLNQVEIENGAMVSLDTLILRDLAKLKDVPQGVEFLTCLRQLKIISPHKRLITRLQETEVVNKLVHIAHIDICT